MIHIRQIYRFIIVTALFIGAVAMVGFIASNHQTVFWYKNGAKDVWYHQSDVYAFTTTNGARYTNWLDDQIVDSLFFRQHFPDKLQLVYFKSHVDEWQRSQVIGSIEQSSFFQRSFPVVTRFVAAPYTEGLWYVTDNQILVTFRNGNPTDAGLTNFKQHYELTQLNDPSGLPDGGLYAYIFSWDVLNNEVLHSLKLCQSIYELDSSMVLNVEPNLIKAYQKAYDPDELVSAQVVETIEEEQLKFYVSVEQNMKLNAYFDFKNQQGQYTYTVVDLFGRVLSSQDLDQGHSFVQLDITDLSTGIYIGCIIDESGRVKASQKFRKL